MQIQEIDENITKINKTVAKIKETIKTYICKFRKLMKTLQK